MSETFGKREKATEKVFFLVKSGAWCRGYGDSILTFRSLLLYVICQERPLLPQKPKRKKKTVLWVFGYSIGKILMRICRILMRSNHHEVADKNFKTMGAVKVFWSETLNGNKTLNTINMTLVIDQSPCQVFPGHNFR